MYELNEGLTESTERKRYLKISRGILKERVQKGTEGAFETITDEGKVVYDRHFANFTGKITAASYKESDRGYKGQYYFDMEANGEKVSIVVNEGTASNVLINKLLKCDLEQLVKIVPYFFEAEKKVRIVVIQAGATGEVKINQLYGRDYKHEKFPTLEKEWQELSVYDQNKFKQDMDLFFNGIGLKQLQEYIKATLHSPDLKEEFNPPEAISQEEETDLPFD